MTNIQPSIRDALDLLLEALADGTVPQTLYYFTGEDVPRGQVFYFPPADGMPDVFLIHPDDVEAVRASLPRYIGLAHFKSWHPRAGLQS